MSAITTIYMQCVYMYVRMHACMHLVYVYIISFRKLSRDEEKVNDLKSSSKFQSTNPAIKLLSITVAPTAIPANSPTCMHEVNNFLG